MAYSTESDIIKALPEETLVELTDDSVSATIDSEKVAEAISKADGEIDSYLAGRYSVPLASVPPVIRSASVDISIYHLYKRRVEEIPETRRMAYKDALRTLERISDGKMPLPVTESGGSGFSMRVLESSH